MSHKICQLTEETKELKNTYAKEGFIHIRGLFDKKYLTDLKQEFYDCFSYFTQRKTNVTDIDIINIFKEDFSLFLNCCNLCQNHSSFIQLASCNTLIDVLKKINIKTPIFNMKPALLLSNKNVAKQEMNWKTPAHQDWPSMRGSLNGATVWIPFVDIINGIGPLEVSPGSHTTGLVKHHALGSGLVIDQNVDNNFVYKSIPMELGDILIFNCFTVHRSGTNLFEDKIRWSAQFRFDDASEQSYLNRRCPRFKKEIRVDNETDNFNPSVQQIQNYFYNNEN